MTDDKIVKVDTKYLIDRNKIKKDSIVEYRTDKKKEFVRGIVRYVDSDLVKIIRSVGEQQSFSATSIGRGYVEIRIIMF